MKNELFDSAPIGVFDSGIGGMSVAKAVMEALPSENILYFGDTIHLPYGKHPAVEIRQYSKAILEFFRNQGCKTAVIACNSATAAVYELIPELTSEKMRIFNVIDPAVHYVASNYGNKKVGLLCTDLTHKLGLFEKKIEDENKNIRLISFKASQLAHLIELELDNKPKLKQLIKEYFFHHQFFDVEAVILGCTHYLWLSDEFYDLNPLIHWIEPSLLIADEIKQYLRETNALNTGNAHPKAIFCQTGDNSFFYMMAKQICPPNYQLGFYQGIWGDNEVRIEYLSH